MPPVKSLLLLLAFCAAPTVARADKGDSSAPSAKMPAAAATTKTGNKPAPVGDKHALRIDLKK